MLLEKFDFFGENFCCVSLFCDTPDVVVNSTGEWRDPDPYAGGSRRARP